MLRPVSAASPVGHSSSHGVVHVAAAFFEVFGLSAGWQMEVEELFWLVCIASLGTGAGFYITSTLQMIVCNLFTDVLT